VRRFLIAVSLSASLAGCGAESEAPPEPVETPALAGEGSAELPQPLPDPGAAAGAHLLLVTLDTTRADRLGCYGAADAATPNLDRLAARGLRFTDAVSPVPMTLPAHASLMTGLDPPAHGVRVNGIEPLAPEQFTLAEALSDAGYRTAAFVSSFVLDPRFGLDQGFESYDATLEATRAAAFEPQTERSATSVTESALSWLAARGEDEAPFFLWVHYFDPHDPYQPPEPFAGRFRGRPYDGEIAYVDSELGRLLAAVPPETLVVVAGDHGESLGEHGERYHSRSLYEGAVRVPLIVVLPGSGAGARAGEGGAVGGFVVTLGDLYPTLLDLLGLDGTGHDGLDGRSLVREPADAGRTVYLETRNPWIDNGWAPLYAARSHDRKYVLAPVPELYDLAADPAESRNLLAGEGAAGGAAALRGFLERRLPDGPLGDLVEGGEEGAGGIDPEVRRRLEALGYLSTGSSGGGAPAAPYEELPDPKEMLPLLDELSEGRRHLASGRPEEAERSARRVLEASPRDRSALQLLAESYATRGRAEDAERVLRRSLEIGPTLGACVLLAQVVMQRGGPDRPDRADEAEALLDLAAETDPRHGAVLLARGDLALVRGRPEEALARYQEAADADPYRFAGLARARIERLRRPR
jgi:choline-sulfatase